MTVKKKKRIIMILLYIMCVGTICYGCRDIRIEEIKGSEEVMKDIQFIRLEKSPIENNHWTFENETIEITDRESIDEIINEILNCKIKQGVIDPYVERQYVDHGAAYSVIFFNRKRMESVTIDLDRITLSFLKDKKSLLGIINQLKQRVETYKPRLMVEGIDLEVFEKHFEEIDKEKEDENKNKK